MSKGHGAVDVKLKGWNPSQAERAASSLKAYVGNIQNESNDMFVDDDEIFYLQISLKKMPMQTRKDKPVPLPLPHPLLKPEGAAVCLFVKDHKGEGHTEAKQMIGKIERKGGVSKVIGLSKLRTKYESFEAKRELCKLYDIFLADERVIPSLPKLIGKAFFKKKKQPIPIKINVKDFPGQVKRACAATYMFKNSGTCINIRVGRSGQSEKEISENIHASLCQAVEHIPKKWDNIQGVFLKTPNSVALPLFQTLPDAALRISTEPRAPETSGSKPDKKSPKRQAPPAKKKAAAPASSTVKKTKKVAMKKKGRKG